MKISHYFLIVFSATLTVVPTQSRAALFITEVMAQSVPSGNSTGTPDWFEVRNTGAVTIDLAGYKVDDNSFSFASAVALNFPLGITTLDPGETEVFLESTTGAEVSTFRTFWGGSASTAKIGYYGGSGVGLGAAGDGVVLFDSAGVEQVRVTFTGATTGTSFSNPTGNATLSAADNSVVGVNGAYTSADPNNNIGSPGAVPEPSTCAFVGLGVTLALGWRRRLRQDKICVATPAMAHRE